jgi:hypothetical protein
MKNPIFIVVDIQSATTMKQQLHRVDIERVIQEAASKTPGAILFGPTAVLFPEGTNLSPLSSIVVVADKYSFPYKAYVVNSLQEWDGKI